MKDKICLVTGATSGIGKITARALAAQGAHVIVVGRNQAKCEETIAEIKAATNNQQVEYMLADLSSQAEVRALAAQFNAHYNHLDVLVNNAGNLFRTRKESADGIEMTFALNHLAYFLLTNLLMDALKTAPSARIVNVSSDAHRGQTLDFDDLEANQQFSSFRVYGRSKLANVLFTYELAKRLSDMEGGENITVNALHPGVVRTNFARSEFTGILGILLGIVMRFVGIDAEEGAKTSIYLASSPEVEGVTGKYFDKQKAVKSTAATYDEEMASRLWQISEEMTNEG